MSSMFIYFSTKRPTGRIWTSSATSLGCRSRIERSRDRQRCARWTWGPDETLGTKTCRHCSLSCFICLIHSSMTYLLSFFALLYDIFTSNSWSLVRQRIVSCFCQYLRMLGLGMIVASRRCPWRSMDHGEFRVLWHPSSRLLHATR